MLPASTLEWHADGSSLRPVLDAAARLEVLIPSTRGDELAAHLPRLRELHLRCYNGATRFRSVVANHSLTSLNRLGVQGTPEDAPESCRELARADHLVALRRLVFQDCGLGDAGVEALLDGPLLDRIAALELTICDITDDGAQRLAADPRVSRLVRFTLDDNLLSPIGVEALAAAGIPVSLNQRFMPNDAGDIPF